MKLSMLPSLSFIIPAYRDEDTIECVVRDAVRVGKKVAKQFEIIVINDASPDQTGEVLIKLTKTIKELQVITHTDNTGYGGTIRDLYYAGKCEWLYSMPGDNQIPAEEVMKLIPHTPKADMIIGWRVNRQDPPERLRQSKIYNWLLRVLFGLTLHDVNSVRLVKKKLFDRIILHSRSAFVDAELAIRAKRLGFRTLEVPIAHRGRDSTGAGGGKLRTILPTIWDMLKFRIL